MGQSGNNVPQRLSPVKQSVCGAAEAVPLTNGWNRKLEGSEGYGAPGRSRTSDLLVRSQLLYPAELRAHIALDATL